MSLDVDLGVASAAFVGAPPYPVHVGSLPAGTLEAGRYALQFASSVEDLRAIQRLRFEVFNLELGEGLESAYATGRDEDEFDAVCHHLMVRERSTGAVVGTYRLMVAPMARERGGFYSETEFDFRDMPPKLLEEGVEVGRACVHPEHRNGRVVLLLWRGLARYLEHNAKRYLFGCCSLPTLDQAVGRRVWRDLRQAGRAHADVCLRPLPALRIAKDARLAEEVKLPALFQGYLKLGAQVCSEPAVDRSFKVIDFFVVLDLERMDLRVRGTFMGSNGWTSSGEA